jgi:predicted nucleotidyltransferase
MVTDKDKKIICDLAGKYGVKRVLLFGSSLDHDRQPRDIDLAVDGIDGKLFFKFYGELLFNLSKPVDLVDLSEKNKFNTLITSKAVPIYG